MRRGFSYALSLGVLLTLTILTGMLLWRLHHQSSVEHAWWRHEQAALNCQGAVNAFLENFAGANPKTEGEFSFVDGVGFSYQALPFGAFWLLRTDGFADGNRAAAWQLVGSAWPDGPGLHIDQPLRELGLGQSVTLDGRLAVRQRGDDTRHPLFARATSTAFPDLSATVLQRHVAQHYREDWRSRLETLVPDTQWWADKPPNLKELAEAQPEVGLTVLQLNGNQRLSGDWLGERPLLILADADVVFDHQTSLTRVWVVSKGTVRFRGGVNGKNLHVVAESIAVNGAVDLRSASLTAFPTAENSRRPSVVSLYGRGTFTGSVAALAVPGGGRVVVQVGAELDTQGLVWSGGDLQLQGQHSGRLLSRRWVLSKSGSQFVGRLENVALTESGDLWSPWLGRDDPGRVAARWGLR